ncbi:MAG: spore coat U domain-containing protein [Terriglobia bacterium]|nr:spore coat U domain-containing protein [Terriglobia bacterium]
MKFGRSRVLGLAAATALLGVLSATPALAGNATTTFPVTATVATNCLVSANPLNFGTYTQGAGNLFQSSTINVNCSKGVAFNVGLNAGATSGATVTTRAMLNGTNQLDYDLFQDSGHSLNWGDTVGTDTEAGTGLGFGSANLVAMTVYGEIPDNAVNQADPAGSYSDTVTVTVSF